MYIYIIYIYIYIYIHVCVCVYIYIYIYSICMYVLYNVFVSVLCKHRWQPFSKMLETSLTDRNHCLHFHPTRLSWTVKCPLNIKGTNFLKIDKTVDF